MFLRIDPASSVPIYEQIVRQVKFAIANRTLQVGEHVPSVREMASQGAVNPNTVARAYRELQADGILVPIRGTGLAVTPEAPQLCRKQRLELVRERLQSVLTEALQNQIEPDELRKMLESELKRLSGRKSTRSE
ncbi:MAG TPA: GntR family transcriptional regulator [Planctomicrobium sp.]|nr:GntR family transcriptional regulator [Planctomicrobium sp.]